MAANLKALIHWPETKIRSFLISLTVALSQHIIKQCALLIAQRYLYNGPLHTWLELKPIQVTRALTLCRYNANW